MHTWTFYVWKLNNFYPWYLFTIFNTKKPMLFILFLCSMKDRFQVTEIKPCKACQHEITRQGIVGSCKGAIMRWLKLMSSEIQPSKSQCIFALWLKLSACKVQNKTKSKYMQLRRPGSTPGNLSNFLNDKLYTPTDSGTPITQCHA